MTFCFDNGTVRLTILAMGIKLPLQNLFDTVFRILEATMVAIAMQGFRKGTPVPSLELVVGRIRSLRDRFVALARHAIAGTLPKPRSKRPAPERPEGWTPKPRAKSQWPTAFGWGAKLLGSESLSVALQIGYLIDNDAEMKALLAAAPQAGRILRPLFWMTGAVLPMALRLPDALRPPPEGYVPGNERYRRRNPLLGFSVYETLTMQGWRAHGHYPERKPRPSEIARSAEAKRKREAGRAREEARLRDGGGLSQRPPPRSRKLGI